MYDQQRQTELRIILQCKLAVTCHIRIGGLGQGMLKYSEGNLKQMLDEKTSSRLWTDLLQQESRTWTQRSFRLTSKQNTDRSPEESRTHRAAGWKGGIQKNKLHQLQFPIWLRHPLHCSQEPRVSKSPSEPRLSLGTPV